MSKPTPNQTIEKLLTAVVAAGGERLAPTNPYEVARFRTLYGVGVIYRNARGKQTWTPEAEMAQDHIKAKKGSLAPVVVVNRAGQAQRRSAVLRILERDGGDCFFCGLPLADDVTLEHLVPIAHGGPNHISNLVCAHAACNLEAGHLSVAEKVALAVCKRTAKALA
ncbi:MULTISPECIES: HNH endonuclease [unclassified Novosphingobium]|uniref:HNH endonuclease n=1 Tax=unclassified Novosphingobium TaxID=2644732 RepID=UPI000D465F60|nr:MULTISPECIES: HNH endonuclease [unclassified Novosphingobium]PTR06400.1 HNH endonuclease [Novosphingobium sp. GV055]PUA94819.1 HNH endonuclease [Novosphingobium sp. GV061]PUB13744.1 HNH endonuclease [Novosphingobium sp. GV079]PUB38442.1 HNH endonuclease [Novosphingobium sp. GV027]